MGRNNYVQREGKRTIDIAQCIRQTESNVSMRELKKIRAYEEAEQKCPEGSSNESFPCLVGRNSEEGCVDEFLSEKESRKVGKNIVADDNSTRQQKP